jgi:hypothetical protein
MTAQKYIGKFEEIQLLTSFDDTTVTFFFHQELSPYLRKMIYTLPKLLKKSDKWKSWASQFDLQRQRLEDEQRHFHNREFWKFPGHSQPTCRLKPHQQYTPSPSPFLQQQLFNLCPYLNTALQYQIKPHPPPAKDLNAMDMDAS